MTNLPLPPHQALAAAHRGERITVRRPMEPQPPAGTEKVYHIIDSSDESRVGKWTVSFKDSPGVDLLWTPPHKPGDVVAVGEKAYQCYDHEGQRTYIYYADFRDGNRPDVAWMEAEQMPPEAARTSLVCESVAAEMQGAWEWKCEFDPVEGEKQCNL